MKHWREDLGLLVACALVAWGGSPGPRPVGHWERQELGGRELSNVWVTEGTVRVKAYWAWRGSSTWGTWAALGFQVRTQTWFCGAWVPAD